MHYKGIGVEGRLSSIIQHFYSVFFYRSKGGDAPLQFSFPIATIFLSILMMNVNNPLAVPSAIRICA